MESALSSKATAENLLQKMVAGIKGCIAEMKEEFEDCGLLPLTDDSPNLNKFCGKLELLLQIGMRERTGIFGGSKNYWDYLQECLSNNKNLKDGIRFVKSRSELKTNVGRGRALIRFSLIHHRLADTIQYCLMNGRQFNEWYSGNSLFHHKRLAGDLVSTLYDLNDLQFDLDPRDAELDTCWPTFSRKSAGVVYNWQPPSRTGSIASLSSIPNLEMFPNLSSSLPPNIEEGNTFGDGESWQGDSTSEDELESMKRTMAETTTKYNAALHRIEELEKKLLAKELSSEESKSTLEANEFQTEVQKQKFTGGNSDDASELSESRSDALMSTIASLQRQLMEAVNARESLSEKSAAANLEAERLKKFEEESDKLRKENVALNESIEALHKDLREIKLKSKEENFFEKAFGDVMHERATAESLLEQTRKENVDLQRELKIIKDEKDETEEKLDLTISENHHLLKTNSHLQNSLEKQIEMRQGLESEVTEIKARNKDLEINISTLQSNFEELEKESNAKYKNLLSDRNEIKKFLDEKEKSLDSSIKKNSSLEEEMRALMQKDKVSDEEETKLQKKIAELEEKLDSNQTVIEEKVLEAEQARELAGKLQEEIKEATERNIYLESEKLSRVKELEKMSEVLRQQEEKHLQLADRLRQTEEKLELQQKLSENSDAERDKVIEDLKEDLEALSGSVQRREKMWESARICMDKDIQEKSAYIQKLERSVADGFTKEKVMKMERRAIEMEEALEAIKLEQEIQTERGRVQLDDLKQCLGCLEHEKFLLLDQISKNDELHKKERTEFQKSQQLWKAESKSLNNDINELKKRIIKLVKEKADLWQKTDDLAYEQKLRASYQWMNSADIANCLICRAQFSMTVRKHHCRKCGRVLCYNCSNNWVSTPHSGMKERVCDECILKESFLDMTVNSARSDDSDAESLGEEPVSASADSRETVAMLSERKRDADDSSYLTCHETSAVPLNVHLEDSQSTADREPVQGYYDGGISECKGVCMMSRSANVDVSMQEKPEAEPVVPDIVISVGESQKPVGESSVAEQEDNIQTTIITTAAIHDSSRVEDGVSEGAWSLTSSARAAVSWMSTAANATGSFAAGLIPRSTSSPLETSPLPTSDPEPSLERDEEPDRPSLPVINKSVKKVTTDDVYDVISPEEVSESRLYPISSPNVTCCPVVRLCDDNVRCLMMLSENELLIKAGRCFAIPVSIEVVGLKLSWEFSTQPKGISFSVTYKESDSSSDEDCVSLIPLTRLSSHQQVVTGELKAKKLGVYALLFDNQSSRFTAKKLKYQLHAEMSEITLHNSEEVKSVT